MSSRADKIEIDSNKINIIDYKTGNISSSKSIYTGQTLQLLIEGLIAIDGGFSCQYKKKKYQLNSLKYIQLSGLEEPAKILEININDQSELMDKTNSFIHYMYDTESNNQEPFQDALLGIPFLITSFRTTDGKPLFPKFNCYI